VYFKLIPAATSRLRARIFRIRVCVCVCVCVAISASQDRGADDFYYAKRNARLDDEKNSRFAEGNPRWFPCISRKSLLNFFHERAWVQRKAFSRLTVANFREFPREFTGVINQLTSGQAAAAIMRR